MIRYDTVQVTKFEKMCERFWQWFAVQWNEQDRTCFETFEVLPELQGKDYDREKKCKYFETIVD